MFEKETDLGQIHFSRSVIERIIKDAVSGCDGKVTLENYKGRYMGTVSGKGWDIVETDAGLDLVIYIIIAFGAGIGKYSKQIIEYVTDRILAREEIVFIFRSSLSVDRAPAGRRDRCGCRPPSGRRAAPRSRSGLSRRG